MASSDVLPDLSDGELDQKLAETREELFNLRFRRATGQLENGAAIRTARRQVARIMTELRHREIAAAEAQSEESRR
ncbi:50S ribosomal protein L29 [Iamia sp.]|uniref:50S ribosomal protein L29 n=1 Tax=Iamia sp. TaxID=2722710 RepID=UPI002CF85E15|nr:50S ribosomal protein L29 [Iamia sp.]HXH56469.1 50S ribosomal protein L29 [Iamia sp.]